MARRQQLTDQERIDLFLKSVEEYDETVGWELSDTFEEVLANLPELLQAIKSKAQVLKVLKESDPSSKEMIEEHLEPLLQINNPAGELTKDKINIGKAQDTAQNALLRKYFAGQHEDMQIGNVLDSFERLTAYKNDQAINTQINCFRTNFENVNNGLQSDDPGNPTNPLIQIGMQTAWAKADQNGNPMKDADGSFIGAEDGNPLMNSEGQTVTDANGYPLTDKKTKDIVKDDNGNVAIVVQGESLSTKANVELNLYSGPLHMDRDKTEAREAKEAQYGTGYTIGVQIAGRMTRSQLVHDVRDYINKTLP